MKYKINSFLFYDAAEGSLKLDDGGKSDTQLTITANALLFFLLKNPGVISRDEVMKRVWDDNGLVSSNSNLNQYLSMLRKAFRRYGIENAIVTVARGRLEINPALAIELLDDSRLQPAPQAPTMPMPEPEISAPSPAQAPSGNGHDRYWGYCGALLLLLAIALFSWAMFTQDELQPIALMPVAQRPFELFSSDEIISTRMREDYVKNFIAVKEKKGIKSGKDERFLFFYGDKLQTNGLGRTFLAHCAKHEGNAFSYCDNYFYYSWK